MYKEPETLNVNNGYCFPSSSDSLITAVKIQNALAFFPLEESVTLRKNSCMAFCSLNTPVLMCKIHTISVAILTPSTLSHV